MSIYCGGIFGGGQGYADICGKTRVYSGNGELDQCHSCQKKEIDALRVDAARYRWLTEGKRGDYCWNNVLSPDDRDLGDDLDSCIDAQIVLQRTANL